MLDDSETTRMVAPLIIIMKPSSNTENYINLLIYQDDNYIYIYGFIPVKFQSKID